MRSCWSLRPIASPAMNAPMMNASWAASASTARPEHDHQGGDGQRRARAGPARDGGQQRGARRGCRRCPESDEEAERHERPSTRRAPTVTESPVTTLTTTVRMIRPSTSSATAAPSTMRASTVASARRSPKTRAVMPTLVAVERGAEEDRRLGVEAEPDAGAGADDERDGDADDGDEHRGPADPAELAEVHLHADLDEQQQHADLGEHAEADAALAAELDEPEHGRSDDDAGDDLAEHRRYAEPLGHLGRQLGRGDDDEEVEQQPRQVDGLHDGRAGQPNSTRAPLRSPSRPG